MKQFLTRMVLGIVGLPLIVVCVYYAFKTAKWLSTTDFMLWVIAGVLVILLLAVCYHVGELIYDVCRVIRDEIRDARKADKEEE